LESFGSSLEKECGGNPREVALLKEASYSCRCGSTLYNFLNGFFMIKAIALFSGGLDSMLAAELVRRQNI